MSAMVTTEVVAGRAALATLTVDLAAVAHNTRVLRGRTRAQLMAVVKADGFGHGAVAVARTALAHGATWLGVTSLEEALALRRAGLRAPVLSWLNSLDTDFAEAVHHDIDLAVPSLPHLTAIAAAAPGTGVARVHLHLDTGMARDGAPAGQWAVLCHAARIAERHGLVKVVGVMGHLGCADDVDDPSNAAGRAAFEAGLATARSAGLRPRVQHLAATAATLNDPASHHSLVRVGAGLVGIDPTGRAGLRGGLTLTAALVSVNDVPSGTAVGYGHTWRTPVATRLGLVPIGYADGVPRAASGHAEVLVRGRRRPVVGRISMDQLVVDLGGDPVQPGEVVTVFGPGTAGEPTVADWARWAGTIEHEVVTGIGPRVVRVPAQARLRSVR